MARDGPLSAVELLQFGDEHGEFTERHVVAWYSAGHLASTVNQLTHYTHSNTDNYKLIINLFYGAFQNHPAMVISWGTRENAIPIVNISKNAFC